MLSSLAVPALQSDVKSYSMEAGPPPKSSFWKGLKKAFQNSLCIMETLEKKYWLM